MCIRDRDESILKDKNVLLAEDNDINAAVAMEILKAHGLSLIHI